MTPGGLVGESFSEIFPAHQRVDQFGQELWESLGKEKAPNRQQLIPTKLPNFQARR